MAGFRHVITPEQRALRTAEIEAEEAHKERMLRQAKRNLNFLQLGRAYLDDLQRLIKSSPVAAGILFFLARHMNRQNSLAITYSALGEATGHARSTLAVAVKLLEVEQWIKIEKIGRTNVYLINASVFWSSARDQKKFAYTSKINPSSPKTKIKAGNTKNVPSVKGRDVLLVSSKGSKK